MDVWFVIIKLYIFVLKVISYVRVIVLELRNKKREDWWHNP